LKQLKKQLALQPFCKEIHRRVSCWATVKRQFFLGDSIIDETASNIHAFGAVAACWTSDRSSQVRLHSCCLVVLAQDGLHQSAALRIHEAVHPHDLRHQVVCSNQFGLMLRIHSRRG
jgi:hypothetical protein